MNVYTLHLNYTELGVQIREAEASSSEHNRSVFYGCETPLGIAGLHSSRTDESLTTR